MNDAAIDRYHARMGRVFDYIDAHLDDTLSSEVLSGVAAFSRFHFQRQFAALFGISLHRYVQLARLKRASWRLAFRLDQPVTGIALDSGYEAPEAFARAFRHRMGQTPTGFRARPRWEGLHRACATLDAARSMVMKPAFAADRVRVLDTSAIPVAVMSHRGNAAELGDTIRRFIAWRRQSGLPPRLSATFNVFHTDMDADPFQLDLCAATDRPVPPNDAGVVGGMIPGGRCAVLRLIGGSDDLRAAIAFLYGEWLPSSGEELRDSPVYAQRLTFFPDVAENQAVTDIFLPLQPAAPHSA